MEGLGEWDYLTLLHKGYTMDKYEDAPKREQMRKVAEHTHGIYMREKHNSRTKAGAPTCWKAQRNNQYKA